MLCSVQMKLKLDLILIVAAGFRKAERAVKVQRCGVAAVAGKKNVIRIAEWACADIVEHSGQSSSAVALSLLGGVYHHVPYVVGLLVIVVNDHHIADHPAIVTDAEWRTLAVIDIGLRKAAVSDGRQICPVRCRASD